METINEDIVIVGAGIAGLTTSLGLHRLCIQSLVLESSESLRAAGFAFATWTNGWKALDAVGVGDILRHQHVQIHKYVTTSLITGQQTSTTSFQGTEKHGPCEVHCVRRKILLEVLAKELPGDTIRFKSKVVAIEESGFYKLLHLADGTIIKTKVLIGCDGVNSVVAKWLGFKKASHSGRYAIRGSPEMKTNHGILSGFLQYFGKGFRAGFLPCDDKTVYWFFTWTSNSQGNEIEDNPAKLKQSMLNKLEKMPSDVRSVIENTRLNDFLSFPMRYRHPWELIFGNISKGNVCVVGDALHPTTPDLGQGACLALEDGVVLARCLGEAYSKIEKGEQEEDQYKKIEEGLKKYANHRRWRCIDIITTSYILGSIQEVYSKLGTFFRDKVLAAFLANLFLKKSDFDCGKLNSS
ncbi:hypothetical protein TanjilG_30495 [Lupinus angustifolius]|uniref:FAD-binding domain-containing protein n=1 Tax=Lupinus angustifolius TaxID=3871 RepID=A0A394DCX1_LUPAN|nr:PREDICTED: uncharacterized protein LOC109339471 isoform X1 [Lupinus angustifolius]OIW21172.1 hypothetical protein TanjilG_30495 [Lupinus angustifolius]